MAKLHTHYDNLKVARNAPPEVIRAAYKTLSQRFHPDRNGGDDSATRTFQIINSAYEILSDPVKRKEHDEWIARQEATEPPSEEMARETESDPPVGEYLNARARSGSGSKSRRSRNAVKTFASSLRAQTTEQRAFTYLFCCVVATLILFIVFV